MRLRSIHWKSFTLPAVLGLLTLAGCFQLSFDQYIQQLLDATASGPRAFDPGTLAVRIINNADTELRVQWAARDAAGGLLAPASSEFLCGNSPPTFCCDANSVCDVLYEECPDELQILQTKFVDTNNNELGGQDFTGNPQAATYGPGFYGCGSVLILRIDNPPPTLELLPL